VKRLICAGESTPKNFKNPISVPAVELFIIVIKGGISNISARFQVPDYGR